MARSKPIVISKSNYKLGLGCLRLLWCVFNAPERIPPVDEGTQAIFDVGHDVGDLAKKRYPGGIEVPYGSGSKEKTANLVKKRVPIFEGTFAYDVGYCKADILVPVGSSEWDLIEVKSSASLKEDQVIDVAFQKWVIEGSGLHLRRCHVMHLNNEYIRHGPIDVEKLFTLVDVTEPALELAGTVETELKRLVGIITGPEPAIEYGVTCLEPTKCPVCSPELADVDLLDLNRIGKKAWPLINKGIRHLTELPPEFKLSELQKIQLNVTKTGKPYVDKEPIQKFLKGLTYPVHCLDFETMAPAIPLYDGTRPFQKLPFQFSLVIIPKPGSPGVQHSFLAHDQTDPRTELLAALKKIGPTGTVLTYNMSFEKAAMEDLAEFSPTDAPWIHAVIERIEDLYTPFRTFWYYHPSQKGSASIKYVLPAMTGKGYDDLAIHEGNQASREFMRVTFGEVTCEERETVRKSLVEYCGLDTQGMVEILTALEKAVKC